MKAFAFLIVLFSLTQTTFAAKGTKEIRVDCEFNSGALKVTFEKLRGTYFKGDPLLQASFEENGTTQVKTASTQGAAAGRGTGVVGDKDNRPAALMTFNNGTVRERVAAFYCTGDGNTVNAKYFSGTAFKTSVDIADVEKSYEGTCTGEGLRDLMTSNCAAFK